MVALSRTSLLLAALLCLSGLGCEGEEEYFYRLHGPTDVFVLEPGGVFEVPVAYAPNFRTGQVVKLDLKRFDMLVEDSVAPFISSPYLPCGRDRVLDQITVTTDGSSQVDVFVSDNQRDQVLRVPHVIPDGQGGFEFASVGGPYPTDTPAAGEDGMPLADGPILDGLDIREGYATTEEWSIVYRGASWEVTGTRSGRQLREAVPGVPYESDDGELAFTVLHRGADVVDGTNFTFYVDTGIVEFDVPGIVADLQPTPEGTMVVASVIGYAGASGLWIHRGDDDLGWVDLPAGAVPENMSFSAAGDVLYVADSSDANRVFSVAFVEDDPASFVVGEIPVNSPSIDVVEGRDPDHPYLFVAEAYGESVDIFDLTTGDPVDVNPWTAEVDSVWVGSLITGLAASEQTVDMNTLTPIDEFEKRHAVVATTYAGYLHLIEADSGCQAVETAFGPYLESLSTGSNVAFEDVGPTSDTAMLQDPVTSESVTVNPCGGIAQNQGWTVRYHEATLDWEVEGSASGVQELRAIEDTRYVSDDGEVSFVITSGAQASTDGDYFQFWVNDGVSPIQVMELPADPVIYTDVYGARSSSWWSHNEREIAVVANPGDDVVMWIHMEGYGEGGLKYIR